MDRCPAAIFSIIMGMNRGFTLRAPCSASTADWAEDMCLRGLCAETKWSSIESPGYGKGYTYLAEEFDVIVPLAMTTPASP